MKLHINGTTHEVDVESDTPLLWVIRDTLNMTGTKYGCGQAQCGACTVYIDGQPSRSCVTPVQSVADKQITTIEGLNSKAGKAVKEAWKKLEVVQCGYCQSGQILAAGALLENNNNPDDAAIDAAMSGNICRCASYARIRAGIKEAAKALGSTTQLANAKEGEV